MRHSLKAQGRKRCVLAVCLATPAQMGLEEQPFLEGTPPKHCLAVLRPMAFLGPAEPESLAFTTSGEHVRSAATM
jgi:hypothetical protein